MKYNIKKTSKETYRCVKKTVLLKWKCTEQSYIDRQTKNFKDKLELCIQHNDNNNFHE